jgi:hypothetical protein
MVRRAGLWADTMETVKKFVSVQGGCFEIKGYPVSSDLEIERNPKLIENRLIGVTAAHVETC